MTKFKKNVIKISLSIALLSLALCLFIMSQNKSVMKTIASELLFYEGESSMVLDGVTYNVNEKFRVLSVTDETATLIGKAPYNHLFLVSHLSDDIFAKFINDGKYIPLNKENCTLLFWEYPAWRDSETKLVFYWASTYTKEYFSELGVDEAEVIYKIYEEFGCNIASINQG